MICDTKLTVDSLAETNVFLCRSIYTIMYFLRIFTMFWDKYQNLKMHPFKPFFLQMKLNMEIMYKLLFGTKISKTENKVQYDFLISGVDLSVL